MFKNYMAIEFRKYGFKRERISKDTGISIEKLRAYFMGRIDLEDDEYYRLRELLKLARRENDEYEENGYK